MNIVVIGSGWLGLPFAEHLFERNHPVSATRRILAQSESLVPILQYPSSDGNHDFLAEAAVVVLAFPPDRSSLEAYANDCLQIVENCGPQTRFLMISSTSVYPSTVAVADEQAADDADPRENRILFAERAMQQQLGNRLTILRLAGLIGPGRFPVTAMSRSGKTYHANDPVNVIHLEDAVRLSRFLVENDHGGEIVNGCAAEHPLKKAYYSWMAGELSIPCPLFEAGGGGKIIDSAKSRKLGFNYRRDDPYSFLED